MRLSSKNDTELVGRVSLQVSHMILLKELFQWFSGVLKTLMWLVLRQGCPCKAGQPLQNVSSRYARKEPVAIDILATSRKGDRKIMQFI